MGGNTASTCPYSDVLILLATTLQLITIRSCFVRVCLHIRFVVIARSTILFEFIEFIKQLITRTHIVITIYIIVKVHAREPITLLFLFIVATRKTEFHNIIIIVVTDAKRVEVCINICVYIYTYVFVERMY